MTVEYPLQGGFHHPAALVRTPKPSSAPTGRSPGAATQNGTAVAAGPYITFPSHAPAAVMPPWNETHPQPGKTPVRWTARLSLRKSRFLLAEGRAGEEPKALVLLAGKVPGFGIGQKGVKGE